MLNFFFIFACKEAVSPLPVDKNKIASVLEDLYIAESMADGADLIVRDSVKNEYLNQVVRRHGLTRDGLDSLLLQLASMPDSLYMLQGMALDSLRARQLLIREKENLGL